jgi:hypothetical protein
MFFENFIDLDEFVKIELGIMQILELEYWGLKISWES